MTDTEARAAVVSALGSLSDVAERAMRKELATTFDLGHSGRLQFEVDPFTFRIELIQTENDVVPENAIFDLLPPRLEDRAESAGIDVYAVMCEEVVLWLAERWQAVGGPRRFRPAYAFFHGGMQQPRYDLEHRQWVSVGDVSPDETSP